jgi:hypothetical protein
MNMAASRKMLASVVACATLLALSVPAGAASESSAVIVDLGPSAVVIQPALLPHFDRMTLRIVDGAGQFVVDTFSLGEPISWVPGPDARDGHYRYEAVVITRDPALAHTGQDDNSPGGVAAWRRSGTFRVMGGVIVPPPSRPLRRGR